MTNPVAGQFDWGRINFRPTGSRPKWIARPLIKIPTPAHQYPLPLLLLPPQLFVVSRQSFGIRPPRHRAVYFTLDPPPEQLPVNVCGLFVPFAAWLLLPPHSLLLCVIVVIAVVVVVVVHFESENY